MSDPVERMMAKLHNKLKDSGSTLPSGSGAESDHAISTCVSPIYSGPPAVRDVPRETIKLEWLTPAHGARGYRSKCGRYSISSVTIGRVELWSVWKLIPKASWFAEMPVRPRNEAEARAYAQRDSEKR